MVHNYNINRARDKKYMRIH